MKHGFAAALTLAGFLFMASRFAALGDKPYHHDESLYAFYSFRYATEGAYKFDPMLHGPFLFHAQAASFTVLPINDATGRLPSAVAGLLAVIFGALLLRRFDRASVLLWAGAATLSPVFCYFARFLGMDAVMTALALGLVLCAYEYKKTRLPGFLYLASFAAAFMVCTKLNSLFYFFFFLSFFLVWRLWPTGRERGSDGWACKAGAVLKAHRWHFIAAGILFAVIFCALYSSLRRNPGGILDGLYREMIPYWVAQHKMQRIKGPFHYYIPIFLTYELPLVLAVVWLAWRAMRSRRAYRRAALIWTLAAAALWIICAMSWAHVGAFFQKAFHLDFPVHPPLLAMKAGLGVLLLAFHFRRGEVLAAFLAYWGVMSLLLYSYAGEKVPWLTTHISVPFLLYVALVLPGGLAERSKSFRKRLVWTVLPALALWQGFITYRACFLNAADPRETLVYTHTSEEIVDLVGRIDALAVSTGEGPELNLQVVGDAAWPMSWYLRGYKRWYHVDLKPADKPHLVVYDWPRRAEAENLLPGYTMSRVKFREWWVPDSAKVTPRDLIRYFFKREVFSPLGHLDLAVFEAPTP